MNNNPTPKISQVLLNMLKEKGQKVRGNNGEQFEDQILKSFKEVGFSVVTLKSDTEFTKDLKKFLKEIKPQVVDSLKTDLIENTFSNRHNGFNHFIVSQPYNTQMPPDFLVFSGDKIFEIDSKYSNKDGKKPMYNGSIPKKNCIYIFGSYEKKDITFFRGEDVISDEIREHIVKSFMSIKKLELEFEAKMEQYLSQDNYFNKGFGFSIRKAYKQINRLSKGESTDVFEGESKTKQERNTIDFLNKHE